MALVWNQRRQKHMAAMREQQQQQQRRQAEMQASTGGSGGTELTGRAAVAARKQAVLEIAQAKAKAHRRHQDVLAEIRSPVATALSPPPLEPPSRLLKPEAELPER
jgi:hypothetical protein